MFFKITFNSFEREEIYIYGFGAQTVIQGFPYVLECVTSNKTGVLLCLHLSSKGDNYLHQL